ncbi:MAG: MFS transporter [Gemmatimonadaceae bacterium]
MSEAAPVRPDPYAALRHTKFARLVLGIFALTLGVQIQGTVVGWQMYDLTHDPLALGLIGLAEALPALSTALYAGHVADRHDRRRIVLVALGVLLACSGSLWFLAGPWGGELAALEDGGASVTPGSSLRVRAIYAVIIVSGVARAFLQSARQAMAAELVPRALFKNAITWRTGAWQLASVLGPALGGLLYAVGGTRLAYAVDGALMAVAVAVIASIRHRSPPRAQLQEPVWASVAGGVRFVTREPVILGALTLDLFSVFFGGAVALLPIFAAEILHVGPTGLGLLRAAPAAGAVGMGIVLARHHDFERTGHVLLWSVAGFGVCMIGFGLSTSFLLSLAFLFASGLLDMVSVVIRSTLLQSRTPEALLGRVSSVNQLFVGSSNEIGMFESGVTARWFGTAPSVVMGGVATLGVVALTALVVPTLRTLRRLHPEEQAGV